MFCCILHNVVFEGRSVTPLRTMEHVPPHVWKTIDAMNSAATQDDGGDEVEAWPDFCLNMLKTLC